eukprot:5284520-Pyramimonas_sp.AAC.1
MQRKAKKIVERLRRPKAAAVQVGGKERVHRAAARQVLDGVPLGPAAEGAMASLLKTMPGAPTIGHRPDERGLNP